MNCLAWNCQGLGGLLTIQNLGFHIREHNPQIIFLSETRAKGRKIEFLKTKFDFHGVCVDSCGKSGGLALLWRKDLVVDLQSLSRNHIDIHISEYNNTTGWRFTGFYGEPDAAKRQITWDLLNRLSKTSSKPWLCTGDFNALLSHSDKQGGNITPGYQLRNFRDALQNSGLSDIGFSGYPFTWSNGWEFPRTVEERLDRACASISWSQKFPFSRVDHLPFGGSDHSPILIRVLDKEEIPITKKKRRFMFESMWMENEECATVIHDSWGRRDSQQSSVSVWDKLKVCSKNLVHWSNLSFGNVRRKVSVLRENIDNLRKGGVTADSKLREHGMNLELEDLLGKEEKLWQQRAKAHWMREGDKNTRYFHSRATGRKKKNQINGLRREDGTLCKTDPEIEKIIVDYFSNIFTSSHPSNAELDLVLSALKSKVSLEDNQYLLQPFTEDEVKKALFSMYPLKSPGPDGFPPIFFQKYWHIVSCDVIKWVLDFLNLGIFYESCNFTNIVLIPKCSNPEYLTQFRPISLCNVVYKIASKTIANRLKPLMNSIISDSQSAFVPGRQITDNVLVAFETTHYMKKQTKGDVGQMAIKLDLSKAYDRVEWDFLKAVMIKLGFDSNFVNLIMTCVCSVSYSFILNGVQFGSVKPERGIRQGDPLSPYLFLFCAESLSSLISREEERGNLEGISICKGAPKVSHLLFADDTLILCKASVEAAISVHNLLQAYGMASGQSINFDKSSVVFTRNTSEGVIESILSYLPIRRDLKHDRYLGLPLAIGKSKKEVFDYIRERVWSRIQSLRVRSLSKAGKEVLIKSVLQAIPSYLMSCFKLPGYLVKEIESMIANFWWDDGEVKKIHWMKWDTLCNSKRDGGLGFRDLDAFNSALLAKQGWKILTNPESLFSKVLKARYFPHTSFLEAELGNYPSLTWRSIWGTKNILVAGIRWRIGDGRTTRIWGDSWLPRSHFFKATSYPRLIPHDSTVHTLFGNVPGSWNRDLIKNIFCDEEVNLILSIPLGNQVRADCRMWNFDKSGHYTVRTGYHLIRGIKKSQIEERSGGASSNQPKNMGWIWKLDVPPKVKNFIWSCCLNIIPVRAQLKKRKITSDDSCPRCDGFAEDVLHCLLHCNYARQVWALSGFSTSIYLCDANSVEDWFQQLGNNSDSKDRTFAFILCWWLWFGRNKRIWESDELSPLHLVNFSREFFLRSQTPSSCSQPARSLRDPVHWSPPPQGTVKINFDAALREGEGRVGLGFVARDYLGSIIGWKSELELLPLNPETAEALAARRALEFCYEAGWSKVILEGDSYSIIQGILSYKPHSGVLGPIFDDIKFIASSLESFQASHVFRDNNSVAHALARIALYRPHPITELPEFINDFVLDDIVY